MPAEFLLYHVPARRVHVAPGVRFVAETRDTHPLFGTALRTTAACEWTPPSGSVAVVIRRRYTVVIVGMRGMARSQRSEVSRHRSERDAFDAAATEVERLTTMHGERSAEYAVVVERDGVVVSDSAATEPDRLPRFLHQADGHRPPPVEEHVRVVARSRAPAPETDEEDDGALDQARPAQTPAADVDERSPEPASSPASDDGTDFEFFEEPPVVRPAAPDVSRAGDEHVDDDGDAPASGPVPDAVLRRFEEAIAREEQRRGRRPPPGGGPSRSTDRPR